MQDASGRKCVESVSPLISRPAITLPARTKRDVIAAAWEALDCAPVGARELELVQAELVSVFGKAGSDSPAAIARVLADEGAELRHPEILECDARWREQSLSKGLVAGLDFGSLDEALASVVRLWEIKRADLNEENRRRLREHILAARADCLLRAGSALLPDRERAEAKEIASWLGVWLNTPDLFHDWLELRRLSPQFLKKFGA